MKINIIDFPESMQLQNQTSQKQSQKDPITPKSKIKKAKKLIQSISKNGGGNKKDHIQIIKFQESNK